MSQETKSLKPGFLKSLMMSIIILAVIIGIIIGFNAIGLPSWPFIFFVFYFTTIANMAKEKLLRTSIGGFIGMTAGFSQNFLTLITGNEAAGLIGFLILVTLLIALMIDGRVKVIDTFCMFMLTVLTGYAGGVPVGQYVGCVISYVIAALLFAIISAAMPARADSGENAVSDTETV